MSDLNKFRDVLAAEKRNCNRALQAWKAKLEENPMHAFTWARDTMACVAMLSVVEDLYAGIKHLLAMDQPKSEAEIFSMIIDHAKQTALNAMASYSHSSSPTSNLMEHYTARAWAKVANYNGLWL